MWYNKCNNFNFSFLLVQDDEPTKENEFRHLGYNNTELPVVGVTAYDRTKGKPVMFATVDVPLNKVKVSEFFKKIEV